MRDFGMIERFDAKSPEQLRREQEDIAGRWEAARTGTPYRARYPGSGPEGYRG